MSNRISEKGLDFIKQYEELRLEAYKPTPNDVWTIGWGTTRINGRPVRQGEVITVREARDLFRKDILVRENAINSLVEVELSQNQFDALVSFVYNIGIYGFKDSTLLRKLNNGDYDGASKEFKRWNKQAGKVLNGLTRRRLDEAKMFGYVEENKNKNKKKVKKSKNVEITSCQTELKNVEPIKLSSLEEALKQEEE